MLTATRTARRTVVHLKPRTLEQLYQASAQLTELLEDAIEEQAQYRPEFLRSLKQSLADVRAGRVRRINSLADLR